MSTIFEKIIAREIPAQIVFEDDTVIAFLDIKPVHLGHTLVVPKVPFADIFTGDPATLGHMMEVATLIGRRLKERLGADGVNLIMNNGAAAGQEVFHAHLHVIPRYQDDRAFTPPTHDAVTPEELSATAEALRH
jgi:histidine triad (HIT) family protein